MPLITLATDRLKHKLAQICTNNLFLKGSDGVLAGYLGIAYPFTSSQNIGIYTYRPRYEVSQTKQGKNELCAKYFGFINPSQKSGTGKQANCKTNITGMSVLLKGKTELARNNHQSFVCYFKGDSDGYNFHSAWTAELLRP